MTDKPLLLPTNDFVFKKIFAEHTDILTDLLMSVLDLPPEEYQGLVVVDPYLRREALEDKQSVLDVKIRTRTQKTIDVEVQVRTQPGLWKRMQYYTGVLYAGQIRSGNDYHLLTRAISILIADFRLLADPAPHHCFRFYDAQNRTPYPDSNEIHILEVPKAREADKARLDDWLSFFAARTPEDFMTASAQNPAIAQAYGIIKTLSADEEARLLAESREKGRRDAADRLHGALQEGELKGELKGRLNVARAALRKNLPIEMIVDITGLSADEIERLAGEA